MNEHIQLIASRIKELQKIAEFSVDIFAQKLKIEPALLTEYESGNSDIPVSVLIKIATLFKMELSALLRGDEPKLHVYSVVRKGKGLNVNRRKEYKYENLACNFVNKELEPFVVTVEPDSSEKKPEYNSHPGQEFNFVLEGTLLILVDGHEIILNEGDSIYFDSGYQHAMKALNNQPAKFLAGIVS